MGLRAFLELPNGMTVRVGPAGLLVGRHKSCDIQLADASASRRHALLRVAPEGVELVVLGRQPVQVNERAIATVELVRAGDRVRFPGLEGVLRTETVEDSVKLDYCLRRGDDRFPINVSPFVVGTGPAARVAIAGWPDEAFRLHVAQGLLFVTGDDVVHGDAPIGGDTVALALGDTIGYRGETFAIEEAAGGDASTIVAAGDPLASAVTLHPLPRGGRVTFAFPDGERTVYLPGRRFQLMSALVDPPPPHASGEFVPDSEVVPRVWTDDDEVGGRQDINVLLTRCRQDLVAAGIAATRLLERAPGGRATRVRLAAGAKVTTAES